MAGASGDPDTYPTCALDQLLPTLPNGGANTADFPMGPNGGCGCYVEGAAANGCPQAILFTNGQPPHGATVSLQCIEQAVTVLEGGTSGGD